jgi:serine/threonine protein kinase
MATSLFFNDFCIPDADLEFKGSIGRGAFAHVYKCNYFGATVAVKVLRTSPTTNGKIDSQCLSNFRREAQVLLRARHPNIVLIIGVMTTAGTTSWRGSELALVTEFCDGGSIADILYASTEVFSVLAACRIAFQVASALAYIHAIGIVHRDVKSDNVFLVHPLADPDALPHAKLGDFGLARFDLSEREVTSLDESAENLWLRNDDHRHTPCVGTCGYMAPEMATDSYGTEVDVYSLGVFVHECIMIRRPCEWEDCRAAYRELYQLPSNASVDLFQVRKEVLMLSLSKRGFTPSLSHAETEVPTVSNLLTRCWDCSGTRATAQDVADSLQATVQNAELRGTLAFS